MLAYEFDGVFNTGAAASWGRTVAGRVPTHAPGPYRVQAVRTDAKAMYTNEVPAGAFRGFGCPQAALATEMLIDQCCDELGLDHLEIRYRNALRKGDTTCFGQQLEHSAGLAGCLEQLRPHWRELRGACERFNEAHREQPTRRGAGIAVVGTPKQIAATLDEFVEAGCTSFCLSGYPHAKAARMFSQKVLPLFKNRLSDSLPTAA